MRLFRFAALNGLLALIVLGSVVVAMQTSAKPITRRGLVDALKIGGLAPNELVRKINERGVSFTLTPDAEDELRKAGAPQLVIDAVRNNYRAAGTPPPSTPPITVEKSEKPFAGLTKPGLYIGRDKLWGEVSSESVTLKKGRFKSREMTGVIPGVKSPNAFRSPISFLIVTPAGSTINDFVLVVVHSKKEEREFKIDGSRTSGKDLLPFTSNKIADQNFQIEFTQGAGEYGFLAPSGKEVEGAANQYGKIYTFRVVQ